MKSRFFLPLFFLAHAAFGQSPFTVDETARFLAGMPVEGALAPLMTTPGWPEHAREMEKAWATKQAQQILPIRKWMAANAAPYFESSDTMFYMFAGPDFLYANVFYPNANIYILAGLEPVGQVPDFTRIPTENLSTQLAALRGSMSSVLRFQYFITKDMRTEFGRGNVSGTLPILYVFLARLGYTVIDSMPVQSPASGVKITFRNPAREEPQTLFYFKTDLAGDRSSAFLNWCAARGPGLSLIKAASFLMHGPNFNGVRNFLLSHSEVIVQDDSGIPLRAFPKGWDVHCYGRYVPHRTEFAKYTQPDLLAVYQKNPPSPLGFAFGYHWQKEEGLLMLATPPEARRAEEMPPVMKALPLTPEEQAQEPRI